MLKKLALTLLAAVVPICSTPAADLAPEARALRVDPRSGNDTNDGMAAPVKTIARAVRIAQPGDTIHLAPVRYFESADLTNKSGEADKPITLDGHGAVLDGSEPVRAADWEAMGGGLFRKVKLLPRTDDAIVGRWFFMWDGKMNHMGRTSKGRSAPLKKPADLQPDEWTYVKDEDAFYIRLAPERSLNAANIRYPKRSSGVIESGKGSHLTVRNIIATHVYNDGYNIHGAQRDMVFENIAAIECGDDGFSAHEDGECRIDGFASIGNSTGMCDTVSSITHYRNVFIRDCLGYDVFFIGDSPHSIENGIIESSALRAFEAGQHSDRPQTGPCEVVLKNVRVRRPGTPQELHVSRNSKLNAERCTFLGLSVQISPGGEIAAQQCIFGGDPKPTILLHENALWRGAGNLYDLKSLRLDKTAFTAETFGAFQKLTGSDVGSQWGADAKAIDTGADDASLKPLEQMAADVLKRWRETK
jgi:hypothetical protein